MKLYTSFDLHSNNSCLGIKDENGKPVFRKKLPNDPEIILMLETGPITRFAKVGNYVSYCRKVSSKWLKRITSETLIQMGDWYSEELIPKLNETTAMVGKSMTAQTSARKFHFLAMGWAFSLDREPSNG